MTAESTNPAKTDMNIATAMDHEFVDVTTDVIDYHMTPELKAAVKCALSGPGPHAMILTGPAGTGKTSLAKHILKQLNAAGVKTEYIYVLGQQWLNNEDLHSGVNVAAAITGDAENVHQPGALLLAARASRTGKVIMLFDEIDKTNPKIESLLLGFLQDGTVPTKPGVVEQGKVENIIAVITSNGMRKLLEPTERRCFRFKMKPLPPEIETRIIMQRTGVCATLVKSCVAMANVIRSKGRSTPSLQEIERLVVALGLMRTPLEYDVAVLGFLCKDDEYDFKALRDQYPGKSIGHMMAELITSIKAAETKESTDEKGS